MKKSRITAFAMSAMLTASACFTALAAVDDTTAFEAVTEEVSDGSLTEPEDIRPGAAVRTDAAGEAAAEGGLTIYATPSGTGDGSSEASPKALKDAISQAAAGDEIIIPAGTWSCTDTLKTVASGSAGTYITVRGTGTAVLDFSNVSSGNGGLEIKHDYWRLENLSVTGAKSCGVKISGSHNRVTDCRFYANGDTGLQISGDSGQSRSEWPSDNYILNCSSHDNYDAKNNGENADGFAAKIMLGADNVFNGCMAWHNSDDGWDLFAKDEYYPDEACTIMNCIAFGNGYLSDGTTTEAGDGNGFKLGSADWAVPNRIINSLAFDNMAHGFTDNNNTAPIEIVRCTAFDNNIGNSKISGKKNYQFALEKDGETSNILSIYSTGYAQKQKCDSDKKGKNSDTLNGTIENSVIYSSGSRLVADKAAISTGTVPGTALDTDLNESIFGSVTVPEAGSDYDALWRDENGNITLGTLFKVNDGSYSGMGACLSQGIDDYRAFTEEAKKSDDYNDGGKKVAAVLEDKYINFSDYFVSGGNFTSLDTFEGPANPDFGVVVSNKMNLGDVGNEKDFLYFETPDGESHELVKRLRLFGDPTVTDGAIVSRAVRFSVSDKATITVWAMTSASGSLTVYKADGTVYDETQIVPITASTVGSCVFSVYEAGTYYLGSYGSPNNSASDFLYAISQKDGEVAKEKSGPVKRYELNCESELSTLGVTADSNISSQSQVNFVDGYFTAVGADSIVNKKGKYFALPQSGNGRVRFTIGAEKADVTLKFCSTGGSNDSVIKLAGTDNDFAKDGTVHGQDLAELSVTDLPKGTYEVFNPATYNRAVYLSSIAVLEKLPPDEGTSSTSTSTSSSTSSSSSSGRSTSTSSSGISTSSTFGSSSSGGTVVSEARQKALDAIAQGKGSTESDELSVKSGSKKNTYELVLDNTASGNQAGGTLTLLKGDKIWIPGYDKASKASLVKDATGCVSVSGKGMIKAKRATSGATISFALGAQTVTLKIVVKDPAIEPRPVDGSQPGFSKLNVKITAAGGFDIVINAPLTTAVTGKVKQKGGVLSADAGYISVDDEGKLHVSGTVTGSGTLKIPFTNHGKKYNLKITAKI